MSIIVTTTLKDLQAGAGRARTAGGTRIPLPTLIRWAATSHHYLAVFDHAKPLALFHTQRFANLAQRMMLLAKEGGCTRPGCHTPAYHAQVHHVSGWTTTHLTDIHDLAPPFGGLWPRQPPRRKRLDHPQKRQRRHRMAPTRPP